ncbi:glycosyltransferase family 39 protein [Gorillibacterium sp. CAU 1737]|uniref:ArnT family glycosyltransferase n=1 Tax=Gorillibacterium sp. CAU 1737 TaxID=3140362 RepID=UPI00326074B8
MLSNVPLFSLHEESKAQRTTLHLLAAFVFVLGAIICLAYGDSLLLGNYAQMNNDDVKYIRSAEILLSHGMLTYHNPDQPTAFIMPGLPLLVAFFRSFLGRDEAVMAFRLFQCVLQAGSVYLIYLLSRQFFSRKVAMIAAVLAALYVPSYYASAVVLTETTFTFLLLLSTLLTVGAVRTKKWSLYGIIGVLWAFMTYLKPQSLLFPAILFILWLVTRHSWRDMLRFGVLMAMIFVLLLSPWWIRNERTFGEPILLTESSGNPLLLGTFIYYGAPSEGFFVQYPQYRDNLVSQSDRANQETAIRIIRYGFTHQPFKYLLWYLVEKPAEFFRKPFYWEPILGLSKMTVRVYHYLYVALGLIGVIHTFFSGKWKRLVPLYLVIGYFMGVYIPFVVFSRYGYPLMLMLMPLIAYGAHTGVSWLSRKRGSETV